MLLLLSFLIATVSADVRLTRYPRGRLEVNIGRGWHEVCGHWFWDNQNGAVSTCKALGYPSGGRLHRVGGRLSNPIYIGQCHPNQLPGSCTGGCCTGGACRNRVNCGDCKSGSGAVIEIECYGQRTKPPTPRPTTKAPTPAPTTSPTPAPTLSPTSSPTEEASYGNIIEWLKQLIAEGKAEIASINRKTTALRGKLSVAQAALTEAERLEGEAEAAANAAAAALGKAQGAWKACHAKFVSETRRLKEEIAIFTKVRDILNGLINGKGLLEEEKADVKALISEEDQADPVKVKAIVALVQNLINAANAELRRLISDTKNCRERLQAAEKANAKAIGVWKAAQKAVEDAEDNVAKAQGELDAHTEYATKRIAVVKGEIEQFEEIIVLLSPLFE